MPTSWPWYPPVNNKDADKVVKDYDRQEWERMLAEAKKADDQLHKAGLVIDIVVSVAGFVLFAAALYFLAECLIP